ncbi:flippase-like domain-containing protein [bacterium]|nr:flippase-like domain-containing protein [bacterium]
MKKRLKNILPWCMACGIFYLLFTQTPPKNILNAILHANIPLLLFYIVLYFTVVMLLDVWALQLALSRFVAKLNYSETLLMRGATYLLMVINYNVGQGGIVFYLKRTHEAPVFKTIGTLLLMTVIDFSIMLFLALVSVFFNDIQYHNIALKPYVYTLAILFYGGFFIWIAFWLNFKKPFLQKLILVPWINKLVHRDIFYAFKEASLKDYLKFTLLRLPLIVTIVAALYLMIHGFYSHVPFSKIFLYGPIVLFSGAIPITPSGLGTSQALFVEFFKSSLTSPLVTNGTLTPSEILLAGGLIGAFGNLTLKAVFGLYCLSKKSKDLFTPPSP